MSMDRSQAGDWRSAFVFTAVLLWAGSVAVAQPDPVAWWPFDPPAATQPARTVESVGRTPCGVGGYVEYVPGCVGSAVKLDGLTAYVRCPANRVPRLRGPFTIEAWVALGTYPWNACPIVDHQGPSQRGYFFGIDVRGRLVLQLFAGGETRQVISETGLPLRQWVHVAGVFHPGQGARLYINGQPAGSVDIAADYTPADKLDLLIGRHRQQQQPAGAIRPRATLPVFSFFDGLIDELKIYDVVLTAEQLAACVEKSQPSASPAIEPRVLPSGPSGPGPFGAFYTTLSYTPAWDRLWRMDRDADVLVRFDRAPYRFVFWRGTNYIPCWVTAEGMWYTNEFNETWGHGAEGCAEPMSDKQCRYSRVRILENSDARAVVHWRYALADIRYTLARVDPTTGWGDWSDEVYTLYPDGVGVRKVTLWSSQPMEPHEFQDSITIHQPGRRPDDDIETEPLTLANMKGETRTYSWAKGIPQVTDQPEKANIQVIHLKSDTDPFFIVSDAPCTVSAEGPRFRPYREKLDPERSIFPWWNHWPVARIPSDGRYAFAADRPSHSCITNQTEWADYEVTANSRTRIMLHGLTDKTAGELVPLAKSWLRAPKLTRLSKTCVSKGYDPAQRAYVLARSAARETEPVAFRIEAGEASPLVNLAVVIEQWGRSGAELKIDGQSIARGSAFRFGHRARLEGTDLVVWIETESTKPISIELIPSER